MSRPLRILIAYSQVPFMSGGIELVAASLIEAFQGLGHQAEPLTVPFLLPYPERITQNCMHWRALEVERTYTNEEIDLVVPLKFPAYGVRHPRKVAWIFHQYREAYELRKVEHHLDVDRRNDDLAQYLFEYDQLSLKECRKIFVGSATVGDRLRHFNDIDSEPLFCPSPYADDLSPGEYRDYVVMAGRLEPIKRPHLLIEALAQCESGVKAILTGAGRLGPDLRALIEKLGVQDRVSLLGHVSRERLVELYRNCLGVVYVPFNEDYGLGVLEGFHCAKPVITCVDSGGPTDLVTHEETGLIVEDAPQAIAQAIDTLADDQALAEEYGTRGKAFADSLNWPDVAKALLEAAELEV